MDRSERGKLTVGSPGKKLIAFAVPIIIINLMQAVYNVADMVIIGHFVGAAGMSAVSIGGQITTVVLVVIVAIANGAAAIIGQNFGAGNADAIGRTLRVMYSLAMIVALALTAVVICFASPIPVFYCDDCSKPVCTDESIESVAKIYETEGSNAWFEREAAELLPEGFTCPHCGGKHFTKETDTLDGWFDSGSTHYAAMERDQGFWPATMYIEGLDQYRGWFQSSLLVAVGALGRGAPFKECVTHGWTVDGEGRAMHKSLGNGMDPAEIFNKYGADLLRLWAGSSDYHVDVRCSDEIFKQLSQNYLKFRNTARYCLGNLDGFDANDLVKPEDMLELDKWALTRLNKLIEKAFAAYDEYEFHVVSHLINDFCVVELSNFYLDIIKDRLYCSGKNSLERRSAQTALFLILDTLTKMFSPILAFTCDEIWLSMPHRSSDDARNVVLNEMNKPFAEYALDDAEMAKWDALISVRNDVNGVLEKARADKRIGKPLEASVTLRASGESKAVLDKISDMDLKELLIVSECLIAEDDAADADAVTAAGSYNPGLTVSVKEAEGTKCPRCWMHSKDADHETGLCPRCKGVLEAN